jgi:hypothetical protein
MKPEVNLQREAPFYNWKLDGHDMDVFAYVEDGVWWSNNFGWTTWTAFQSGETAGIIFFCPGCGQLTGCSVVKHDDHPVWTWDGNREKPTLNPSILHDAGKGGCGWHGFLTAGRFQLNR